MKTTKTMKTMYLNPTATMRDLTPEQLNYFESLARLAGHDCPMSEVITRYGGWDADPVSMRRKLLDDVYAAKMRGCLEKNLPSDLVDAVMHEYNETGRTVEKTLDFVLPNASIGRRCSVRVELEYAIDAAGRLTWKIGRDFIKGRPLSASIYVRDIPTSDEAWRAFATACEWGKRYPGAEDSIAQHPDVAIYYAIEVLGRRWRAAESEIAYDADAAVEYARKVLGRRFRAAEPFIMCDPDAAADYAAHVMGGRWPEAELVIASDVDAWEKYIAKLRARGHEPPPEKPQIKRVGAAAPAPEQQPAEACRMTDNVKMTHLAIEHLNRLAPVMQAAGFLEGPSRVIGWMGWWGADWAAVTRYLMRAAVIRQIEQIIETRLTAMGMRDVDAELAAHTISAIHVDGGHAPDAVVDMAMPNATPDMRAAVLAFLEEAIAAGHVAAAKAAEEAGL